MFTQLEANAFWHACARGDPAAFAGFDPARLRLDIGRLQTGLVEACSLGHAAVVAWLIDEAGLSAEHLRAWKFQPLLLACERGRLDVVRLLHERLGLAADALDVDYRWGFVRACGNGHLDVARWIVDDAGLRRVGLKSWGADAMHDAHFFGRRDVVCWLVDRFGLADPVPRRCDWDNTVERFLKNNPWASPATPSSPAEG